MFHSQPLYLVSNSWNICRFAIEKDREKKRLEYGCRCCRYATPSFWRNQFVRLICFSIYKMQIRSFVRVTSIYADWMSTRIRLDGILKVQSHWNVQLIWITNNFSVIRELRIAKYCDGRFVVLRRNNGREKNPLRKLPFYLEIRQRRHCRDCKWKIPSHRFLASLNKFHEFFSR